MQLHRSIPKYFNLIRADAPDIKESLLAAKTDEIILHNYLEWQRYFFLTLGTELVENCSRDFLRATACNAKHVFATAEASFRLSVCPSHCCIVSKRRNLGS